MGDEMDGCECVWSHELAMQRLLAFIRQNQDQCTDVDCVDVMGRMQRTSTLTSGNETNNFTMLVMFLLFAFFMYIIRPESIRRRFTAPKGRTHGQDPRNDDNASAPPPPPPAPPAFN